MGQKERPPTLLPLRPGDPPSLGDIELTARLQNGDAAVASDAGIVYAGRSGDQPVVVVMLTAGAEQDSYGRARFQDTLAETVHGHPELVVAAEDDPDLSPWAALRAESWHDGLDRAGALLAPVALTDADRHQAAVGPTFRPHWAGRNTPGRWRVWPLPWPATLTSAPRWTFAASFAIVLALAAIALFIAVRLFHNLPPAPVPPPFPQPGPTSPATPTPTPTTPSTPSGPPGTSGPPTVGPGQPPIV